MVYRVADRRNVVRAAKILAMVCPGCGAARLIPLSYPVYRRDAGPEVVLLRPLAKCVGCGERIYAHIVARSRQAIDPERDRH